MRIAAVAMLAMLWLTPLAVGQKETFDIAVFEPPVGWERLAGPGPLSFRAKGGAAQIFLFPSRASAGSPEENFQADWARLVTAALGKLEAPKTSIERRADGWTAVTGAAAKGQGFAVLLFTATGSGRAFPIVANVVGREHIGAIRDFFARLELGGNAGAASVPGPAAAAAPPAGGGQPGGLYFQLQVRGFGSTRLEAGTRFFLPGNRITRTFPFGGGDTFDNSRCSPDTCGSYSVAGEQLLIRWDNGQVDRLALRTTAEGIHIDGTLFRPARPMTVATLAGEWKGAADPLSNVYRFERDGTFTFGAGGNGLRGRYRVQGRTLILNFADGTESRRTLFAASPSDPAGMICVEGEVFARRQ